MKLAIGNDHAGVELKNELLRMLEEKGIEMINVGTDTTDSVDYARSGLAVAKLVSSHEVDGGIIICGTGIGISLAANKVKGIRAAVCSEPVSAALSKQHNNANIISLGARIVGLETAKAIVLAWLEADFESGRHARRVDQITEIEETQDLSE